MLYRLRTRFQVCQTVFEEFPELARLSRTQAYRALSDPTYSGKMKVGSAGLRFVFIVSVFRMRCKFKLGDWLLISLPGKRVLFYFRRLCVLYRWYRWSGWFGYPGKMLLVDFNIVFSTGVLFGSAMMAPKATTPWERWLSWAMVNRSCLAIQFTLTWWLLLGCNRNYALARALVALLGCHRAALGSWEMRNQQEPWQPFRFPITLTKKLQTLKSTSYTVYPVVDEWE